MPKKLIVEVEVDCADPALEQEALESLQVALVAVCGLTDLSTGTAAASHIVSVD